MAEPVRWQRVVEDGSWQTIGVVPAGKMAGLSSITICALDPAARQPTFDLVRLFVNEVPSDKSYLYRDHQLFFTFERTMGDSLGPGDSIAARVHGGRAAVNVSGLFTDVA